MLESAKILPFSQLKKKEGTILKKRISIFLCAVLALGLVCFSGCQSTQNSQRNDIVVISDLHLYVDDSYERTAYDKQVIADFLAMIRTSETVSELVINGDLFDQWVVPLDYEISDMASFDDLIAANNQVIVDAINAIITDGEIKVTFVPGNHDMTFDAQEAERIFPGINQIRDAEGLGTYTAKNGEIAIEHGHRYNYVCGPDPISNREITQSDSILPVGYFMTRIAVTAAQEQVTVSTDIVPAIAQDMIDQTQINRYFNYMSWAAVLSQLPLSEYYSDKIIKTNFDGYTDTYAIADLLPYLTENGTIEANLYGDTADNWAERQALNNVAVPIDVAAAIKNAGSNDFTDSLAQTEYFDAGSSARIVVFGHTHAAKITASTNAAGQKVIYANSGSWRDSASGYPANTYLIISPAKEDTATTVSLYQYSADGTTALLQQEILGD